MGPVLVVVLNERLESVAQDVAAFGGVEVDVVVLDRAPQSFDEHVVDGSAHPVHRNGDLGVAEHLDEGGGGELNVGDVGAPDVVGVVDVERAQPVGVFDVLGVRDRGFLLGCQGADAHEIHQALHPLAIHHAAHSRQDLHHHARAVLGVRQVEPVDDLHQKEALRGLTGALVVVSR